jgi:hypothetical protein
VIGIHDADGTGGDPMAFSKLGVALQMSIANSPFVGVEILDETISAFGRSAAPTFLVQPHQFSTRKEI